MSKYEDLKTEADKLWGNLHNGDSPWIRIGTGMCGQAAGALDVLDAIKSELVRAKLNVRVDEVGCLGLCYAEPIVDILTKDGRRVLFRDVVPEQIESLFDSIFSKDLIPTNNLLGYIGDPVTGAVDLNTIPGISNQQKIALRNSCLLYTSPSPRDKRQ